MKIIQSTLKESTIHILKQSRGWIPQVLIQLIHSFVIFNGQICIKIPESDSNIDVIYFLTLKIYDNSIYKITVLLVKLSQLGIKI